MLLASFQSFGQNPYLGAKAGLNLSTMYIKDINGELSEDIGYTPGFHAGPTVDYRATPSITLNASLLLSSKGYLEITEEEFLGENVKSTTNLYLLYLEFPLFVKYEFTVLGIDVFAGGGPYVSYGFYGKYRWIRKGGGETENSKEDVFWGDNPDTDNFIPLDYGFGLTFGGKLDNILLEAGYNLGLENISTTTDNGQVVKNGVAFISFSYFFSKFYKYAEGRF
jgi:hypothetical protein